MSDVQARVVELLDKHADCLMEAKVDQDTAIHYPCGIVVRPPIFGLATSNRAHVAAVLAEADLLAPPRATVPTALKGATVADLTPETLAEWRKDCENGPTSKYDPAQASRILALLDALAVSGDKEARALESARRLFVETRDLRTRAEKAERKYADLVDAVRALADDHDDCVMECSLSIELQELIDGGGQ